LWSIHILEHFSDLAALGDEFSALMEVVPVSPIDIPAAHLVHHVAISRVVDFVELLAIDNILRELHLVKVAIFVVGNADEGARHTGSLGLHVALLHDFVLVAAPVCTVRLLPLRPFLVFERREKDVTILDKHECDLLVRLDPFFPS